MARDTRTCTADAIAAARATSGSVTAAITARATVPWMKASIGTSENVARATASVAAIDTDGTKRTAVRSRRPAPAMSSVVSRLDVDAANIPKTAPTTSPVSKSPLLIDRTTIATASPFDVSMAPKPPARTRPSRAATMKVAAVRDATLHHDESCRHPQHSRGLPDPQPVGEADQRGHATTDHHGIESLHADSPVGR